MNPIDLVILAIVTLAVVFAARHIAQKRKSGCSCGCAECGRNCPMAQKK